MKTVRFDDAAVRYTGRWFFGDAAETTCAGAYFEVGFTGAELLLSFDMRGISETPPHLFLQLDGGAKFEAPTDAYLRVEAPDGGAHALRVIVKSIDECESRWENPNCRVSFLGCEAEGFRHLPTDTRPVIEFIGDSITEGILVDPERRSPCYTDDRYNRVYQDDATTGWAWRTAEALGMAARIMGYGAVGLTRGGSGGVPRAALAYPYAYAGAVLPPARVDYIVINHGANDSGASDEEYLKRYEELLDEVRAAHPEAHVLVLPSFWGFHAAVLPDFVAGYNASRGARVDFVPTDGWFTNFPEHPLRTEDCAIGEKLTEALRELWGLA